MKIKKIKINAYGKLKDKEINFGDYINIIYGTNESGKSTILNYIKNSFYGISKNKNGKEISDFERYTPWLGEEFSGKLEYELETKEKFEIFRDFKKKNPQILNERMEDISKQFNIDKNKGNEFFYEQTKVDESLFSSTVLMNQQEVKLEKQDQNILIQKVANLVGTGEDNVSYKRAIDRINRRILEEIGTERSREKPINLIHKKIEELEQEKKEIEKSVNIKCEIEENKSQFIKQIEELEKEMRILKEEKLLQENEKIEAEKINLKINLKNKNDEKINEIKNQINNINLRNKNNLEQNKKVNADKNKLNKINFMILFLIILSNILQFIWIKNIYFNFACILTIPVDLIFYLFLKNKINKKENKIKIEIEKTNSEIKQFNFQIELLEKNSQEIQQEINKKKIEKNNENKLENINKNIQKIENEISEKKIVLHTLQIDDENLEAKLEKLSKIEEDLINHKEKMVNLKKIEKSMMLAKEILEQSYNKMKNTVTPKFTGRLSETISEITEGKYTKVSLNDETGLMVELENGNYVNASRLSIGTIDQLYFSLRLAMVEELSEEKMPIILDEVFAYYDTKRLENILRYIAKRFCEHQIIIFTCTNREKEILENLNLKFQLVEI